MRYIVCSSNLIELIRAFKSTSGKSSDAYARETERKRPRQKFCLQQELFRTLREEYPERLKKLTAIPGDMTMQGFSLSDADKELLTSQVSVVFHVAADIRFDLSLKTAVKTNVVGAVNIIALAKQVNS